MFLNVLKHETKCACVENQAKGRFLHLKFPVLRDHLKHFKSVVICNLINLENTY